MNSPPEREKTIQQRNVAVSVMLRIALTVSFLAALLLLAAGPGYRWELWSFRTGFSLMTLAAWTGLGGALCALVAVAVSVVEHRWKTALIAAVALTLGGVSCAVPYFWKQTAQRLPKIHDISTDTVNPPRFVAIVPLRANAVNPSEYGGSEVARKQAQGYPDIATLTLADSFERAFGRALDAARRMGWDVVAAVPAEGRIEASDTTLWFGFTDDIVIRITPSGSGSRLDIRSVSRVGVSDVGTNALRIRKYLALMR